MTLIFNERSFTNSLLNAFEAENDSKKSVWLTRRSDIIVVQEASGQRKPGFLIIVRPTVKPLPDDTLDDGFIFVGASLKL